MVQSKDHPAELYTEAKERVISYNSERDDSDDDEPAAEGGSTPNSEPDDEEFEEIPHHTSPAIHFEDSAVTNTEECPECGGPMERVGAGLNVSGKHKGTKVGVRTEQGDAYCSDCEVLLSNDGKVITNVK
jgi:hypothetical protein